MLQALGRDLDMEAARLGREADHGHAGARRAMLSPKPGHVVEEARRRLDRERLAEAGARAEQPGPRPDASDTPVTMPVNMRRLSLAGRDLGVAKA